METLSKANTATRSGTAWCILPLCPWTSKVVSSYFFCCFFGTGSQTVAQAGVSLMAISTPPPCWEHSHESPHMASFFLKAQLFLHLYNIMSHKIPQSEILIPLLLALWLIGWLLWQEDSILSSSSDYLSIILASYNATRPYSRLRIKKKSHRWRDGSTVQSSHCSCRGPKFGSQHPHGSS